MSSSVADQARVDGPGEARIVQLEGEVLAAGVWRSSSRRHRSRRSRRRRGSRGRCPSPCRPGGEAGLGVDGEGADGAGVVAVSLLVKVPMVAMMSSPWLVRPPDAALMVIPRAEGRSTRTACGRSGSGGWPGADFFVRDAKPPRRWKKVGTGRCGQAIGAQPVPSARSRHQRTKWDGVTEKPGRRDGGIHWLPTRVP